MANSHPRLDTVEDILSAALEKEQQAYDFYDSLLTHRHIDVVRDIVSQLKDEEYKHMRLIREKLTRLHLGRTP